MDKQCAISQRQPIFLLTDLLRCLDRKRLGANVWVERGSQSEAFSMRRLGGSRWRLRRTRCAMDQPERDRIEKALRAYCGKDTLAEPHPPELRGALPRFVKRELYVSISFTAHQPRFLCFAARVMAQSPSEVLPHVCPTSLLDSLAGIHMRPLLPHHSWSLTRHHPYRSTFRSGLR